MHDATAIRRDGDRIYVSLSDGGEVSARAVILATGATYRRLGVAEIEELTGAGVFYGGPATEAPAMAGKEVYVLGGANSAGQAALHLAEYARRVDARGAGGIARCRDVALPDAAGRRGAERGGAPRDRSRRGRGRRPAGASGPPAPRRRSDGDGCRPTRSF